MLTITPAVSYLLAIAVGTRVECFVSGSNRPPHSSLQTEVGTRQINADNIARSLSLSDQSHVKISSHDLLSPYRSDRDDQITLYKIVIPKSRHSEVGPLIYQVLPFRRHFSHVTKRPLNHRCNKGDRIFPPSVVSILISRANATQMQNTIVIQKRSQGKCSLHQAQKTISTRNREFRHP